MKEKTITKTITNTTFTVKLFDAEDERIYEKTFELPFAVKDSQIETICNELTDDVFIELLDTHKEEYTYSLSASAFVELAQQNAHNQKFYTFEPLITRKIALSTIDFLLYDKNVKELAHEYVTVAGEVEKDDAIKVLSGLLSAANRIPVKVYGVNVTEKSYSLRVISFVEYGVNTANIL